jgi:uncharacterized protein (TIGR02453 family)
MPSLPKESEQKMKDMDLRPVLDFLSGLKRHNNRAWFEENRSAYDIAKARFENFVDQLIGEYGKIEDLGGITAKDCVMRIYRDTRFSKDKSPYKTNMSATIAPGGKKSTRLGYHLHLQPHNETLVAGGLYMPTPEQLATFRATIGRDAAPYKAVINDKEFKKYFGMLEGEKVKTIPQGYSRDHPEIELLRFKQVVVVHRLPDEMVLSPQFSTHLIKTFKAMKPFLDYLNAMLK